MNSEETKMILNELSAMKTQMNEQFSRMDERFEKIDERFEKIDERFEKIDERFEKVDEQLKTLKRSVSDINLTLENETNRNIKLLAEGHMNLDRKLNEALKVDSEKELLILRVNVLENEVRKLKERSEATA
jgi:DNA anti-recombination protein RmuC